MFTNKNCQKDNKLISNKKKKSQYYTYNSFHLSISLIQIRFIIKNKKEIVIVKYHLYKNKKKNILNQL